MAERAAGVGARVERDPGLPGGADALPGVLVQVAHVCRVRRELRLALLGPQREVLDVDQRRDDGDAALRNVVEQVGGEPGAVLDRVDAGRDQPGQRVLAEDVGGDPRAEFVRPPDRLLERAVGPERGQIAGRPVDPVADDLDPAVAARRPAPRPRRPARPVRPRRRRRVCSGAAARCAARRGSAGAGPRAAALRVLSTGEPASRSSNAPPSRSASACSAWPSGSSTNPCGDIPMWQCASTKPGMIQPPALIVSAGPA